jgi:hypothetical protein
MDSGAGNTTKNNVHIIDVGFADTVNSLKLKLFYSRGEYRRSVASLDSADLLSKVSNGGRKPETHLKTTLTGYPS